MAKPNTITMMLTLTTEEFAAVQRIVSPPQCELAPVGLRMRPPSRPDVIKAGLGRLVAMEAQTADNPPPPPVPRQRMRSMSVPRHATTG